MRARIHHGAHEIGGNCVEVEHDGVRLVLDVGRPLTAGYGEHVALPDIAGLTSEDDDSVLGVLISHHHQDHWGLVDQVRAGLPIYMGAATERILRAAAFWTRGIDVPVAGHLEHRVPFELGPFTITPYLNDHSAFDAYSLLVEAGGESLFYTGDIRGHGRKAKLFDQLVNDPPSNVDTLLMEGTNLQPGEPPKPVLPESAVEDAMVETFSETDGMALVVTSAQNIDRLVTIYRAAKRTGRTLVMDPYSADIARATGYDSIPRPHPDWEQIRTYMPMWQSVRVKQAEAFDRLDGVDGINTYRLYPEHLADDPAKYVLLFSSSEGHKLAKAGAMSGATCTYSLWSGYLQEPSGLKLRAFLDEHDIPLIHHHTSGHASVEDLGRLADAIDATQVVPIHTFAGSSFRDISPAAMTKADGVWWDVAPLFTRPIAQRPGFDVVLNIPYSEGLGDGERSVLGAVARAAGEPPVWVDGWQDENDPKDAEGAWEYYEEGYGVSQSRGVMSVAVRSMDDASAVVAALDAELRASSPDWMQSPSEEEIDLEAGEPAGEPEHEDDESDTALVGYELHRVDITSLTQTLGHADGTVRSYGGAGLPWGLPLPQVQRILDEPAGHHWFPRSPRGHDESEHGAAYYAPLLHTMLFRLGWVRPDRGVYQWDATEYADDEPHLHMIRHLWGGEVDLAPFLIWLDESRHVLEPLHDLVGVQDDGVLTPVNREWADSIREREAAAQQPFSPLWGGSDPLHLTNVVQMALNEQVDGTPRLLTGEIEKREGALLLDTMRGWYRALHTHEELLELEDSLEVEGQWTWEVLVRGVGSLGTFRRSPETGIWHATSERVHRWGVWPIEPDTIVVRF